MKILKDKELVAYLLILAGVISFYGIYNFQEISDFIKDDFLILFLFISEISGFLFEKFLRGQFKTTLLEGPFGFLCVRPRIMILWNAVSHSILLTMILILVNIGFIFSPVDALEVLIANGAILGGYFAGIIFLNLIRVLFHGRVIEKLPGKTETSKSLPLESNNNVPVWVARWQLSQPMALVSSKTIIALIFLAGLAGSLFASLVGNENLAIGFGVIATLLIFMISTNNIPRILDFLFTTSLKTKSIYFAVSAMPVLLITVTLPSVFIFGGMAIIDVLVSSFVVFFLIAFLIYLYVLHAARWGIKLAGISVWLEYSILGGLFFLSFPFAILWAIVRTVLLSRSAGVYRWTR